MAVTSDDYRNALLALLPRGPAWSTEADAFVGQLLNVLADASLAIDQRASTLLDEADPRSTLEMLSDYERVYDVPGQCGRPGVSREERRAMVLAKMVSIGGQSPNYYVGLAKALGYDVSVSEFSPFKAGRSAAGDDLTNENWLHRWLIVAPETAVFDFKAGASVAGDPVRAWGQLGLECPIRKLAPAHTQVFFSYGGVNA